MRDSEELEYQRSLACALPAQGPNRFERGMHFFLSAWRTAAELRCAFAWELRTVRNVGHSHSELASVAVALVRHSTDVPSRVPSLPLMSRL